MSENSVELLASDEERDRTCTLLQDASVDGRLDLEELAERVRRVHLARTRGELQEIVRDLPAAHTSVPTGQSPISRVTAILGGAERSGPWRVGEVCHARVVAGGCKLDLRNTAISGHVTTIEARILAGSLEVIVPEGVAVALEVSGVASSKSLRLKGPRAASGAPVIRIVGSVWAGSLTVRDKPRLGQRLREAMGRFLDEETHGR